MTDKPPKKPHRTRRSKWAIRDLFGWPHARTEDPSTSHEAIPRDITKQSIQVLRVYADGVERLDYRAYEIAGLVGHQRCSDLRAAGFIERTGRGTMPSGKAGYLCRITAAGLAYLAVNQ